MFPLQLLLGEWRKALRLAHTRNDSCAVGLRGAFPGMCVPLGDTRRYRRRRLEKGLLDEDAESLVYSGYVYTSSTMTLARWLKLVGCLHVGAARSLTTSLSAISGASLTELTRRETTLGVGIPFLDGSLIVCT